MKKLIEQWPKLNHRLRLECHWKFYKKGMKMQSERFMFPKLRRNFINSIFSPSHTKFILQYGSWWFLPCHPQRILCFSIKRALWLLFHHCMCSVYLSNVMLNIYTTYVMYVNLQQKSYIYVELYYLLFDGERAKKVFVLNFFSLSSSINEVVSYTSIVL